MKQPLKDINYYDNFNSELNLIIERSIDRINLDSLPKERVPFAQRGIASNKLKLIISDITYQKDLLPLKNKLIEIIDFVLKGWNGFWKLKNSKGKELDQYILSAYDEMLWMLSLSFLLDIPNEEFKKLVDVIDRDGVIDKLFEFIIKAKLPERASICEESYREFYGIPKVFEKLRLAISEPEKPKAELLIKDFLTKEWYKNHKEAGWYNSHKSKHNTYFGYWSFETAAVVAILDLDDSSFRDNQYYPKDLVNYYRNYNAKK